MLLLTAVFGEGAPDVTVNFVSISTFHHNHLKCDETSDLNSDPDMQTLRDKPVVGSEDRSRCHRGTSPHVGGAARSSRAERKEVGQELADCECGSHVMT